MSPRAQPFTELSTAAAIRFALTWQAAGLLLLLAHVLLVRENIVLFPIAVLAIGWLYLNAPLAGIVVYFQVLLYQNLVISLFSPDLAYMPDFVTLQGTNFIALTVMAAIALSRLLSPSPAKLNFRQIIRPVLLALFLATIYAGIGAAKEGTTSALVYYREFTGPLFAILVGLDVGRTWGYKTVGTCLLASSVLALVLALVEVLNPLTYYEWTNAVDFMKLKYFNSKSDAFFSPQDIITHATAPLFNITGRQTGQGFDNFRFGGSIVNPISFAYLLAVIGLVGVSLRRSFWAIVVLPLLVIVGVKGAALLLVITLNLWIVWVLSRSKPFLIGAGFLLTVAYIAFGIKSGMQNNDFHVIGFLGGVHGFLANPIGHGVGVGGNLSANAIAGFKWTGQGSFSHIGADFALESAVGVLIYQMGLASLAIFAVFFVVLRAAPFGSKVSRDKLNRVVARRQDVLFLALAIIVVNGVFQEEAYAPYAAGLLGMLCSIIVANGYRPARHPIAGA